MIFLTLSDVNMGDFGTLWANVELPKSPLQVNIFQKKWDIVVKFLSVPLLSNIKQPPR